MEEKTVQTSPQQGIRPKKAGWPEINLLAVGVIPEILQAGLADFFAAAKYGLFFGSIYAAGGWLLIILLFALGLPYLVYPTAIGFALIAPFIACGFYFISHQLEEKQPLSWGRAFAVVKTMFSRDLGWMALVTGFALFIWVDMAAFITLSFYGFKLGGFSELLTQIFTTQKGMLFLLVGNSVGAVIAFIVFSISVISFPMLYHRDIDFVTAMVTSVRLVMKNPFPMAVWCATIAALVVFSLLTGLLGLLIVLPVLGHATWHLYRRALKDPI